MSAPRSPQGGTGSAGSGTRHRAGWWAGLVALLGIAAAALLWAPGGQATPARTPPAAQDPSRDAGAVLADAEQALDVLYQQAGGESADTGWRWAVYFLGLEAVREQTGSSAYADRILDWGRRNDWDPGAPESPTSNPDSRAAIQVWLDAEQHGLPVDLSLASQRMSADLRDAQARYWWIDALFMGLPLWPAYAERTGDDAYLERGRSLYEYLENDGGTDWRPECAPGGLFDNSEDLWWRDCSFVGKRDEDGRKVFWGRGNGWVIAAMARTLERLPSGSPDRLEYESMLERMSARLVPLQGEDGMWRSSLLNPEAFPEPETSASALITYALAKGVRTGVLDRAEFAPVVDRAWAGLSGVALQEDGFVAYCQGVGDQPGPSSTTETTPFCVGAFALAASEVARLRADPAWPMAAS